MKQIRDPDLADKALDEISIMDVDLEFVGSIKLSDIYSYLTYLSRDRAQRPTAIRPSTASVPLPVHAKLPHFVHFLTILQPRYIYWKIIR